MARQTLYKRYKDDATKLKTYQHRLTLADAKHEKHKPLIDGFFDRYATEPREGEFTDRGQRITVTKGLSNIDALFASLTAVDVEFVVKNIGHGTRDQAKLASAGINETWTESRASEEAAASIKDGLIGGIGFAKVSYDYATEEREIPRSDEEIAGDVDLLFNTAQQRGERPASPEEMAEVIPRTKTVKEAVRDRIVVDYVDWDDVRYDTSAKRWKDVRWVAQYTKLPLHEVVENPKYRDYVKRRRGGLRDLDDLKGDTSITDKTLGITHRDVGHHEDDDRVTVVTMWDAETGTVCTFPKGKKFILDESPNLFSVNDDNHDKWPLVPITFRDDPRRVRGISEMQAMTPALDELELYRTRRAEYLDRFVAKLAAEENTITEAGKAAMKSRDPGAVVETAAGHNPNTSLMALNPPALPQEIFQVEDRLEQDLKETTGVTEPMLGIFSEGRHSATESQQVAQAATARHSEKRNRLERFLIDIARRILMLMQIAYDQPRISRLIELEGDVLWEWDSEDITMEADLQIHLSPKEAHTKQSKRDNALALLNVAGAMPELVNRSELLAYTLEEMAVPPDVIRLILMSPEEQQQSAMAQAQQAKQMGDAEAGLPPDPAETPGPLPAEELAAAVNSGELPPDQVALLGAAPAVGP